MKKTNLKKNNNNKTKNNKKIFLCIFFLIVLVTIIIFNKISFEEKKTNFFEGGIANLYCKTEDEDSVSTTVNKGDIIECEMGFHTYLAAEEGIQNYYFKSINFEVKYGSGFEKIKFEGACSKDYCKFKKEKNKYQVIFNTPDMMAEEPLIKLKLKVSDNVELDNLYILVDNISFNNKYNEVYYVEDVIEKYHLNTGEFYFYKKDYQLTVQPYKDVINSENLQGSYKCENKNCAYITDQSKYVLLRDGNYILFNYEDNKAIEIPEEKLNGYSEYEIIYDENKVYGIKVSDKTKSGYYSIEKEKFIIPVEEYESLEISSYYDMITLVKKTKSKDYKIKYLDLQGNKYKPSKEHLIENSSFYAIDEYISENIYGTIFMNSSGTQLFDGQLIENYLYLDTNELVINSNDKTKFILYNNNQEKVKESNTYTKILDLLEKNVVVLDNNNINIIDYNEQLITTITTIDNIDNYYYSYFDESVDKIVVVATNNSLKKDNKGYNYVLDLKNNEIIKKEIYLENEEY